MAEILQVREAGPSSLEMGSDLGHGLSVGSASPSPFSLLPPLEIASNSGTTPSTPTRGHARAMSSQTALPVPNPAFSFPLQPPSSAKIEPFSYSPTTYDSPTRTSRINHRRGGSEFIGGDGTLSGPGLMSVSPTKSQNALPLPEQKQRRGHAHRRSGAISQHDIRAVMLSSPDSPVPTLFPRIENSDSSPSEPRAKLFPSIEATDEKSLDSEALDVLDEDAGIPPVVSRPRVGFSDRIEFIPRPLSTISSDAASSILTIRQGHSLNGSINSIRDTISGSPSMRLSKRGSMSPRSSSYSCTSSPKEEPSTPTKRPASSSALALARNANDIVAEISKAKELHSNFRSGATKHSLKTSISTPNLLATTDQSKSNSPPSAAPVLHRPRSSPDIKTAARKSKGKSWAGNVFSRLTRHTAALPDPMPTSGPLQIADQVEDVQDQMADFSLEDVNFDDDTTCVITTVPTSSTTSQVQDYMVTEPLSNARDSEDSFAPVPLDLDAAWLSLDSLPARSAYEETNTNSRRSFHRRTESAPTTSTAFGGPAHLRRGPTARMEDVFEEDEDDLLPRPSLSGKFDASAISGSLPTSPCLTPFDGYFDSSISSTAHTPTVKAAVHPSPLEQHTTDAVEDEDHIGNEGLERTSSGSEANSSDTITDSQVQNIGLHPEPPRDELITPIPTAHTQTSGYSFGPPSLRDPSLDGPRLYTANSSRTDQSTWSSTRPGDAQTLGYSTDTVPSLTETSSTRNSVYPSLASALPSPTFPGENSSFFSGSGIGIRRVRPSTPNKRASLVSLSRLMNISHFEKSKLSLALSAADDEEPSTREKKKGTRLSKLMFWKKKTSEQKDESI